MNITAKNKLLASKEESSFFLLTIKSTPVIPPIKQNIGKKFLATAFANERYTDVFTLPKLIW